MKRLFVLSLVAVLSVGLLSVGAFAQVNTQGTDDESATTEVFWNYQGVVQCQVGLSVHSNVNLGTIETVDSTTTSGLEQVDTEGNCAYTVNVEEYSINSPITNSNVWDDFYIRLDGYSGPNLTDQTSSHNNWKRFNRDSNGSEWDFGKYTGNDFGDLQSATWNMRYRYNTDAQDENGEYRIYLRYTVST